MSKFIGRRSAVGVGLETSRGVAVAPTYLLAKTNYTFDDKADKARSGEGLGNIAGEGSQSIVVLKKSEGEVELELGAKSLPVILSAVLGGAISTATQNSDKKHTIAFAESNQHKSLSIHIDEPNGDLVFRGCMVDSFEVKVNTEDIVTATMGLKGYQSRSSSFDATSLKVLDYKFVGRDMVFKVAADTASLGAATAISLKELTLTISKNADYDPVLGTVEPEDILNKQFTIEGELVLNYEDKTWRDYMLNGDYKAIGIRLKNTRQTMSSENPEFYLEIPRCDFSEWEPERGNDDIITQKINFMALLDVANNRVISDCYVVNNIASY